MLEILQLLIIILEKLNQILSVLEIHSFRFKELLNPVSIKCKKGFELEVFVDPSHQSHIFIPSLSTLRATPNAPFLFCSSLPRLNSLTPCFILALVVIISSADASRKGIIAELMANITQPFL